MNTPSPDGSPDPTADHDTTHPLHRLRSQITVISGNAQLARRWLSRTSGPDHAQILKNLAAIEYAVHQIEARIRQYDEDQERLRKFVEETPRKSSADDVRSDGT